MNKTIAFLSVSLIILVNTSILRAQKTITFPSKDGILITADLYFISDTLPYMILCHQADYSRAEYKETAPKFTKFGYNCIAVDLRSGGTTNDIPNETAFAAKAQNKPTTYLDAEQDIIAAIDYAFALNKKKVVLVGSSYSASLAMKIGAVNTKVKFVIAFSPGEYFGEQLNLKKSIALYDKPLFVTSSQGGAEVLSKLIKDVKSKKKQQFIPTDKGRHGSSALWTTNPGYHEYWLALTLFIRSVK